MDKKVRLTCVNDFEQRVGQVLFTSYPIEITLEKIQQYCLSVNNQEWVHWDEAASKQSGLEGIIAPGLYIPSLYPQVFWDHVEIENFTHILVKSIESINIFRPIYMGTILNITAIIDSVEPRKKGIEVIYKVSFNQIENEENLAQAKFVLRYW